MRRERDTRERHNREGDMRGRDTRGRIDMRGRRDTRVRGERERNNNKNKKTPFSLLAAARRECKHAAAQRNLLMQIFSMAVFTVGPTTSWY